MFVFAAIMLSTSAVGPAPTTVPVETQAPASSSPVSIYNDGPSDISIECSSGAHRSFVRVAKGGNGSLTIPDGQVVMRVTRSNGGAPVVFDRKVDSMSMVVVGASGNVDWVPVTPAS